jgi:hypothetical protein
VATADHRDPLACVTLAIGAQDVGDAVRDAAGVRAFARGREAAGAERVGARPRTGGVDHGAREVAMFRAAVVDDELERRVVAAAVLELVDPGTRDARDPGAEVQGRCDLRRRGQRLQVALDDLGAGRVAVAGRRGPAVALKQRGGGRVEVELPRREHAHVTPRANARADGVPGLEDHRLQAAREQVRRGGQPDGAGSDDRDAVGVVVIHAAAPRQGIEGFRCVGGDRSGVRP